jgi:predicted DNA-binding ribbon-helix-helix protein
MNSPVIKRSIVIAGHKTSVSLEDAFWKGLKDIATERHTTLSDLVGSIDCGRRHGNLSSAIRLYVLDYFQARSDAPTAGARADDGPRGGEHDGRGERRREPMTAATVTSPSA